jgi:uncharacterized SAM-binding protein YcdF (DUF218 family)
VITKRMLIFLSKFLPLLVYPLGLACILIIVSLFVFRQPGWGRFLLAVALLSLWLGGNRWVAMGLARSLEWRYLPPDPVPQGDVIVLLGGGTLSAEYPRPMVEVNNAGDRVLYAAWLYRQGKAPYILLSGGTLGWTPHDDSPAQQMADLLEIMGVPEDALWLEAESRNTHENAVNSAGILREQGIESILLVTSASHMPRSVRLFEAQGFEVVPLPTDFTVTEVDWQTLKQANLETYILSLFPSAGNLATTTRILKEYFGILFYEIRGWQ